MGALIILTFAILFTAVPISKIKGLAIITALWFLWVQFVDGAFEPLMIKALPMVFFVYWFFPRPENPSELLAWPTWPFRKRSAEDKYQEQIMTGISEVYWGSYIKGMAQVDAAIAKNPNDEWGRFERAQASFDHGKFEKAIADYTWIIERFPEEQAIYTRRGTALRRLRRYEEAIADLNKAVGFGPGASFFYKHSTEYEDAVVARAILLMEIGSLEEGAEDCTHLLQMYSHNGVALALRGDIYLQQKRFAEAVEDYTQAINIDGADNKGRCLIKRGDAYSELKEFEQAADDYREALSLAPEYKHLFEKAKQAPEK